MFEMVRSWRRVLVGSLAFCGLLGVSTAGQQTFPEPAFNGNRIDWCYLWGEQCGLPAANRYCTIVNYDRAAAAKIASDIGAQTPTITLGDGKVCADASCDGFDYIRCERDQPTKSFDKPSFQGKRVDWCYESGGQCGQPAADRFCSMNYFTKAESFAIAEGIGRRSPTISIADGAICNGPQCDGFASITCRE